MSPRLSVIVPAFNMENYLHKCLQSLVGISEGLRCFLEIIVVNDGSNDCTLEIANSFSNQFQGIIKVVNKGNGHYGSCINAALRAARGRFVKVLDADDTFDSKGLEILLRKIGEIEANDVDMLLSAYVCVDGEDAITQIRRFNFAEDRVHELAKLKPEFEWLAMHAVAYKTENLLRIGYRQTEGIAYTDQEWMFLPMTTVQKFAYCDSVVYKYLIGREGQSVMAAAAKKFADHMKEMTALIERFEGCKTDEMHKKYLEIRLRHFVSLTFNILIQDMPILESLCKFDKFVALAERNPFVWDSANGFSYSNTLHFHPFRFMRRHKIMRLPYLLIFRLYIYLSKLRFGK